MSEMTKGCWY